MAPVGARHWLPMIDIAQIDTAKLDELDAGQLRELTRALLARSERESREITWKVLAAGIAMLMAVGALSLAWFQRLP